MVIRGPRRRSASDESGQAVVEYILLLMTVVGVFLLISSGINKTKLAERLSRDLKEDFARTYRYGHPAAKGYPEEAPYNEGGPEMHPRIVASGNFRIFINPGGGEGSNQ